MNIISTPILSNDQVNAAGALYYDLRTGVTARSRSRAATAGASRVACDFLRVHAVATTPAGPRNRIARAPILLGVGASVPRWQPSP